MKIKLSIIIPVYNSENTIGTLLDRIMNEIEQEDLNKYIEVIVVDDCSNDSSLEIIEKARSTKQFKLIKNNQNFGVSYSRNVGIRNAKGKYLWFVDSDDNVDVKFLKQISRLTKSHCDLYIFGTTLVYKDHTSEILPGVTGKKRLSNVIKEKKILSIPYSQWVTNKLIKKSLLIKNNIFFDEEYASGEDLKLMMNLFLKVKLVDNINKTVYYYNRLNYKSITRQQEKNLVSNTYRNNLLVCQFCKKKHVSNEERRNYLHGQYEYVKNKIENNLELNDTEKRNLLYMHEKNNI